MRRIRTRLWAALLSLCLLLGLLPAQVLAADEMYSVTLYYNEALCTVTANSLVEGDNGMSDPSKTTVIVTGDGQTAQTPAGTWLQFQIDNIAKGYRIGSVTVNGTDRTEGFINGAYGGMAFSNMSRDYELTAVMEPIPNPLPSVTGVKLYTDENGTTPAPESITFTSANVNDKLYGKATFSDGAEHPTYYAMGQWQFSTDGRTWQDTTTWGDNRFDFWPGWGYHEELDFLNDSYDLRLEVSPWDIYTTGDPVYSNVIHVNGGAGTGVSVSLAVNSVSFGTSGPQHTLDWSFPDGVTEEDLANCHLKLELYDADAKTWVLWDNGIYPRLTGGYILEDLLSDSDRPRGHFTKIRVSTVANSDSSVLGSYEGTIDLTVSEAQASDLSAKAVFTRESDGQYTVETSGLTVGQVYCVITDYIDENQAHTQVLATAGGVSATSETMTAENIPVVGDRESLLADASYRVLQFETSMSGSAQLSMTITDLTGWQQCFPPCEHNWGEWTETPATCTLDGSKTRSCTSCGHPETETIPAPGHDWGDWEVTKPSTETEDGSQIRTCKRCGETETEIISKWLKQELEWPININETVTYTYGAPDFRAEATNKSPNGGAVTYTSSNPDVAAVASNGLVTIQNAGTTTITATAAAVTDKYAKTEISYTLVVNKAPLTITANDHTITYGEAPAYGGYTASGFVKDENESVLTGTAAYTCAYQQFGKAGEYTIEISGLTAKNYEIEFVSGKLTVQKAADYTITLGNLEQSIAGLGPVSVSVAPQDNTAKFTVEYLVNGEWAAALPTEAGEYSVRAALTSSDNLIPSEAKTAEGTLVIQEGAFVDTGDGNVSVDVAVDGDKAVVTLPEGALDEILSNAGGDTSIDLGNLTGVKDITLPGDLLDGLAMGDGSLAIRSEDASISMSEKVLDTIADAVTGPEDKVTLHMSEVRPEDMNPAQQAALESLPNAPAIVDLSLTVTHADGSNTTLSELNGNVEITIPYTVPTGMEGQTAVACYISADGYITYIRATYQNGAITFTTNHFSNYAVFFSEKPAVIVTDGSGSGLYAVGDTVKITAASKSGYRFDHWKIVSGTVTLANANSVETTFTMPAYNVEIAAVYTKISSGGISGGGSTPTYGITVETAQNGSVSAQPQKAAAGDTVALTVKPDEGYKLGKLTVTDGSGKAVAVKEADGKHTFVMPDSRVTVKASFVKLGTVFTDVPADAYYAEAVEWAVSQGITAGTSATTFSPDAGCTRGQVVTFLWRAAGSPLVTDAMDFTDVPADAYYAEAVRWAVSQGITAGTSATTFSPEAICTRGQIVTFLWRTAGSPVVTDATGFTDVSAGAYYAKAVRWAVSQGITAGTSATTFSPESICTRSQIVTFLFRAMGK